MPSKSHCHKMQKNIQKRKLPERQCMGCNEKKPKTELIRIVRTADGVTELDFTGKKAGRGAYICPSLACLRKVRKSGRLGRILEAEISSELFDALEGELENGNK